MKKKKETPKGYTIESWSYLHDIINENNVEDFVEDFRTYIIRYAKYISKVRELIPDFCEGKSNTKIAQGIMGWIDDGKHDDFGTIVLAMKTQQGQEK